MELLKRNRQSQESVKQYQIITIAMVVLLLLLFTLGFKIQYVFFEMRSLITRRAFTSPREGKGIIQKTNLAVGEGLIIKDPQESLFEEYVIEFNPETLIHEEDGVLKDGALLGVIKKINMNFAVVSSISRSNSVVKGVIPKTKEIITLQGRGDGDFLSLVPRDYEIETGDEIMWIRNQNIALGEVVDIQFDTRDVYKRVYVRSYVQSGVLEKVQLIEEHNTF